MPSEMERDDCPNCKTSWIAEPIPEASRHHYGDQTHFSRRIALYDPILDCRVGIRCPDCGHEIKRSQEEIELVADPYALARLKT